MFRRITIRSSQLLHEMKTGSRSTGEDLRQRHLHEKSLSMPIRTRKKTLTQSMSSIIMMGASTLGGGAELCLNYSSFSVHSSHICLFSTGRGRRNTIANPGAQGPPKPRAQRKSLPRVPSSDDNNALLRHLRHSSHAELGSTITAIPSLRKSVEKQQQQRAALEEAAPEPPSPPKKPPSRAFFFLRKVLSIGIVFRTEAGRCSLFVSKDGLSSQHGRMLHSFAFPSLVVRCNR